MPQPVPSVLDRLRSLVGPRDESTVGDVLVDPGRRGVVALVGVGVLSAIVAGFFLLRGRPAELPVSAPPVVSDTASSAPSGTVLVIDVEGRVRRPGLVRLPDGSRVDDALRLAGGVLPGTSTASLNLARKLTDGEQLVVGGGPAPAGGSAPASEGGLLDLNTATAAQLDALPGIGPVLAQRIVDWRTQHGGRFASVDQLRQVSGIGEAKYQSLKSRVRV